MGWSSAASLFVALSILAALSCDSADPTAANPGPVSEYVILSGAPAEPGSDDYFHVIDIATHTNHGVPAVIQLDGAIYLVIHSRFPSFNCQVVAGHFIPDTNYYLANVDTIFQIEAHLRDTTACTH